MLPTVSLSTVSRLLLPGRIGMMGVASSSGMAAKVGDGDGRATIRSRTIECSMSVSPAHAQCFAYRKSTPQFIARTAGHELL
jgi:hypothetical protein